MAVAVVVVVGGAEVAWVIRLLRGQRWQREDGEEEEEHK